MNRFKFQPAQEHRRSLQQPKNDHVSLMTTLDKCSQILRDDRLFLRNQIKNCNHQVLEIFKKYAKGSQMAELQVRLRKYVQNVKSRVKTEQLNRFKESLAMNSNVFPQQKRSNQMVRPQGAGKPTFKPSCSTELNRTTNIRSNKSQEHTSNHLNMNSSLRHFQQLLKQKFNQEIIQERQSENVTSARLGRQEQMEQTKPKPLQQQFFDSIENKLAGRVASYNNFIPNKKIDDNLTFLNDFNKDRLKLNQEETNNKPTPWNFQKNAKKVLYQFQNVAEKEPEELNYGTKSRQKQSVTYEDKEDSIFDKHFFGSDKEASQVQQNQYFSQSSSNNVNEIKQPISFTTNQHLTSSNIYQKNEPSKKWSEQPTLNFKLKESDAKPNQEPAGRTSFSRIQNSRPSEENLFTPLQLLNECRNFLKHRDNSTQKSNIQLNQHSETSFAPSEVVLDLKHQQQVKPKQPVSSMKKDEESSYVFPEIKDSNKKQEDLNSTKKLDDTYHFTHFQTFANSQDQKPFAFPSKFANIPAKHTFNGLFDQKLPEDFSIEDFLQTTMQATDMNPFITVDSLSETISSHQNSQALKTIFKSYLSMGKHQQLFLTDLAETLNNKYNQEHSSPYPHDDQVINSVYDLLDIQQKGYINKEDIETFLNQIKEAEVENYDQVEEQLWRLFEGADFNNKHELTYWHFYLVYLSNYDSKTSEEFQRVSQLLGEFQFEIQRNQ